MTRLQCFHVASVATYTASQHIGRSLTPRLHHVHFKLSSFKASMYHSNRLIGYILSNTVVDDQYCVYNSPKYGCGVVACGRIEVFVDAYRRRSLPMIVHVNIRPSNTNIESLLNTKSTTDYPSNFLSGSMSSLSAMITKNDDLHLLQLHS